MLQLQNFKPIHPSLKQIVVSGVSGVIGTVGILFAVALYVVETLIRPKKINPFDLYTFSPYELDIPAEAVVFPDLHGDHKVRARYIPYPAATTTILVCPGYRTRMADTLGISAHLWKAGHNVLAFEYYGHGLEVGTPVTLGYREIGDFLGALAYAKDRAPQNHLGVIAYSLAPAVAIMPSAGNNNVEPLIVAIPFPSHLTAF